MKDVLWKGKQRAATLCLKAYRDSGEKNKEAMLKAQRYIDEARALPYKKKK